MLWFLVFTVVAFNGQVPQMRSEFIAYSNEADCQRAKAKVNNEHQNAFAECFVKTGGQQF